MALALLDNVKRRVIRILNANPTAWSSSVSGTIGAFPDSSEIAAAIFEADEYVVTKGYFQSVNDALSQPYMVYSSNIPNGGNLPFYHGKYGNVLLSTDANFTTGNIIGIEADSAETILNIVRSGGSYLTASDFHHFYYIENATFYHVAPYGKVELPTYTRTNALQAQQSEETLVIATAIRFLTKHASPAAFENWKNESVNGIAELIQDGRYTQKINEA